MSALSSIGLAKFRNVDGRCAARGITATVFGCTGFLGRYVTSELGRVGSTLVIPYRGDELEVRHIKVMADLGNVANVPFNVRDEESVANAVKGSDVVINLIGKHYETKHLLPWWINYTYDEVHVKAAETIAKACAENGVNKLIHVSSIAAHPNSESIWASSKYRGEMAVRKAFPKANIVRPSVMFGPEDRFLNWYAQRMGNGVPLIDGGNARVQPVAAVDVAKAILAMTLDEEMHTQVVELVGDNEYSHKEVAEYVFDATKNNSKFYNVPLPVGKLLGKIGQQFPNPSFTKDQAILSAMDQVKTSNLPGLRELDVIPSSMEKEALYYLIRYNQSGHFQEVSGYH